MKQDRICLTRSDFNLIVSVITLFAVIIVSDPIRAHGTSNLNGMIEIAPKNAKPGSTVQFIIRLHEIDSGALKTLENVRVAVGLEFKQPFVALTKFGPGAFMTTLRLQEGRYNVRVILKREGQGEEIGMNGFVVTPDGIILSEKDSEIWFVPKGIYEPVPWVEHLSGVIFGLLCLLGIWKLLRSFSTENAFIEVKPKPWWVLFLASFAAVSMPLGAFWDISQHLETGRESFFQPPHLLIYGGILMCIGIIAYSIGWKTAGSSWRRHIMRDPAAGIAMVALIFQLLSAPFDEVWHTLFGLDVSIWSPPHAILIFGGMAVCLALAGLSVNHSEPINSFSRTLTMAGSLLIAEVFLAEFEFPIPAWHISQFRPGWVHPLIMSLFTLLVCLVAKRVLQWKFGAMLAVGTFLILRLLTKYFLMGIGMAALPVFPEWLPGLLFVGLLADLLIRTPIYGESLNYHR